jgi:hypothetical protein
MEPDASQLSLRPKFTTCTTNARSLLKVPWRMVFERVREVDAGVVSIRASEVSR